MRALHVLHHDPSNGGGDKLTLGDIVEMIEKFTGYEVNGIADPSIDAIYPRLDAPITAVVRTDTGATWEGRIERLTFHLAVGGQRQGGDNGGE